METFTREKIEELIKQAETQRLKDKHEPLMNDRPEPVYNYLNGLWRRLDEYKPRSYGKYPKSPEIYIMESATMNMYLAWYDTRLNKVFNRQTYEWMNDDEFSKYCWCYKHELFPVPYVEDE